MRKTWITFIAACFIMFFTGIPIYAQQEVETAGASLGKEVYEMDPYQISLCSEGWVGNDKTGWRYIDSSGKYVEGAWRKIDGKWHWLDYNGFWVNDSKYRDYADAAIKGIDVSHYQGEVDWERVKADGIEFVILKIGGNSRVLDPKYKVNIEGANAAGLKVGVYYYSKAQNVESAILDAKFVIKNITGHTISYPVVIDVEDSSQEHLGKKKIGSIAKAFCDEIRSAGYTPMLYCNENWYKNFIDVSQLEDVEKWVARYNYFYDKNIERGIWQCSERGRVDGIVGAVDINFGYTDYSQMIIPRTAPVASYKETDGKWMSDNIGWWYSYYKGGYPSNEWKEINGIWYWFEQSGYMKTGWLFDQNRWYYFEENGAMVTGWKQIGGLWYYFNSQGAMAANQWVDDYYLSSGGSMVTGWLSYNGSWYYMNSTGKKVTGWFQLGEQWYYMNAEGIMCTGWKYIDNQWYYLNPKSGVMMTGWIYLDNQWYYLKSSGAMAVGELEIQGVMHGFLANGTWIGEITIKEV